MLTKNEDTALDCASSANAAPTKHAVATASIIHDPAADRVPLALAPFFTDSLARLTGEEQKAVETTAFDLQLNPANPGMNFHKLDKARDRNFWSVRVNSDI